MGRRFTEALTKLGEDEQGDLVLAHLESWCLGSCPKAKRVAENVKGETALPLDAFVSLLKDFAGQLRADCSDPMNCWSVACRNHQFRGAPMSDPVPELLGRADTVRNYAGRLADGSPLSPEQCSRLIRKVALSGDSPPPRELRILKKAKLGRYLIWATFLPDYVNQPTESPFADLPKNAEAIRTALGLGECPETESLVLVTYESRDSTGMMTLHRPTVGDAASYSWFRPHPDPEAAFGMTEPLRPNARNLPAQPEVVHQEITGKTLVLPVYLAI